MIDKSELWRGLVCAVVVEAANDLHSRDTLTALDALLFWLDEISSEWLDALGYPVDPNDALYAAVRLRNYARRLPKFSGSIV